MFCPNCGSKLPDDARFCGSCGARLQTAQSAPKPAAPVTPKPVPVTPKPAPAPEPVKPAPSPKPPKKGGKKILPVILCAVLVLAIAAGSVAAWQLFFAKETVYLWVESSSYTAGNPMQSSMYKEYDENGNLLRYERHYDYSDEYEEYGMQDITFEISYEYEDGVLTAAEIDNADSFFRLEYTYEKGVLADIEVTDSGDGMDLDVEVDSEGRITELVILDSAGNETAVHQFEYDENGILTEKETEIMTGYEYRTVSTYDERGNIAEQVTYIDGEVSYRYVYAYSEKGTLLELEQYGEDNELYISIRFSPEYDKDGKMTELEMLFNDDSNAGSILFEAEHDGLEMTLTPVEIHSDLDGELEITEDTRIEVVYDEAGNITESRIYNEGELYMENIIEFKEFKVPKGYRKISSSDPFWFPLGY